MNRPDVLKKLDTVLEAAEIGRTFGTVELELRDGKVILLRTIKTERLEDRGNDSHAKTNRY